MRGSCSLCLLDIVCHLWSIFDYVVAFYWFFFFFKQKTAYEMRISDWSSDVCSSDLVAEVWRRGSVIASWLLDLTAAALVQDPELSKFNEIGRASCRERVCQYV